MGIRSRPAETHPLVAQLRPLREAKGWSSARLARAASLSVPAVGSYERGDRQPPVDVLVRLFQVLGHELVVVPQAAVHANGELTPQRMAAHLRVIADRMEALGG